MSKMATALLKTVAGTLRRTVLLSSARASSGGGAPVDQHKGKVEVLEYGGPMPMASVLLTQATKQILSSTSDKVTMPDGLGHAVGPERFELLAKLAGNEDPFEMSVKTRAKGTFEEPTIIPSLFEKRLVGCICEEDAISINWMFLHTGEPKRCECGYWFKLEAMQPMDYSP